MKFLVLTFLTTALLLKLYSQDNTFSKGIPIIKNFSSADYSAGSQNWGVAQTMDGIVYFCNNQGILEFDGENWRLIQLENSSVARTIKIYNDTIFVGGNNTFGYLEADKSGRMKYISYSEVLPENQKSFGDIWYIIFSNKKKYFVGVNGVFISENNKLNKISYEHDIISALSVGDDFLFIDSNAFYLIKDTILTKIYSFESPISNNSYIFKINHDEFLILNKEPIKINIKNILSDNNDFVKKIFNDSVPEVAENTIFNSDIDKKGNLAFATMNGIYIYDNDFKLQYKIDRNSGFITNDIYNVKFDNYGNLWVAHGSGISYIEFNSPITIFNKSQNVFDSNINIIEFKNKLYLSSLSKIKILEKGEEKFSDFEKSEYNNFTNCKIENKNDTILFITTGDKIYYTRGSKLRLLHAINKSHEVIMSLFWTTKHKNRLFIGTSRNLRYIDFSYKGKEIIVDSTKNLNIEGMIVSITSDLNGNIWCAPFFNGVYKLSYNKETNKFTKYSYGEKDGLNKTQNRVVFDNYLKELFIISSKLYTTEKKYNPEINNYKFKLESELFYSINDSISVSTYVYNDNKIMMQGNSNIYSFNRENDGLSKVDSISYKRLSEYPTAGPILCIGNDGIEWIPFQDMLVRFNPKKIKEVVYNSLPPIISEIIINNDSLVYGGRDTNYLKTISTFEYKNNSFIFKYALPFFVGDVEYQYKLEGFDKRWSKLTKETKAVYTNIDAGDYTFIVRGKNVYGFYSKEVKYSFSILPPWYLSIWMYIVYFVLFVLIIAFIVYLFTRNLKARNKKLENIVRERTKELEDKNILITDSIKYAKHIQQAVLPSQEVIAEQFKNAFIFFKPRDIVSGDFYWYHKKNNIHYVAVADCTGHGVPGAFMSMIGNTLLNQIITEENVDTPSKVLGRLNTEIQKAFASSDTQDDGMDITICKIDRNNNTYELSMANHIALLVKDNKIEEIEGDIFSIGGPFAKPQKLNFTNYKRDIEPGSTLYMFSDGFSDQFGGPEDKKLMISKLKDLIIENNSIEITQQRQIFKEYFVNWKGKTKQIDDVLIIGIKF